MDTQFLFPRVSVFLPKWKGIGIYYDQMVICFQLLLKISATTKTNQTFFFKILDEVMCTVFQCASEISPFQISFQAIFFSKKKVTAKQKTLFFDFTGILQLFFFSLLSRFLRFEKLIFVDSFIYVYQKISVVNFVLFF